ncbi:MULTISPECIES: hypothetical protein [unclassified Caulobacter]|uniref:dCTP deaminase domain-containing protein n=1 Tax=unclassified Caulobacter TaxID=2648921 RepID=UPI0006FF5756|nr:MULTISPECIES: hypothetical protein [unclassified Caulobacter]KQV57384.1 hypothetical protein ASC62_14100 [Caulobacter sp. Root342]KQV66956.1 hypothetical protein ASC70_14200 [Caulobacter sp. Root343]
MDEQIEAEDAMTAPVTVGFWSSETILSRGRAEQVVLPFDRGKVDTASYRLTVGSEIFVTPHSKDVAPKYKTKQQLSAGQTIIIPSGQFAILITHQKVQIPADTIGFIGLRSGPKMRGLVNVSGFHVDPGYKGQLVFSVFNAGPLDVHVSQGDDWFMISFAGLDRASGRVREKPGFDSIPSSLLSPLSGQVLTLKGVDTKIDETEERLIERLHAIERDHTITRWAALLVLAALIALGVRTCTTTANAAVPAQTVHEVQPDA